MKRKILQKFKYWKENHSNKPLMVLGSRQVGKTYALNEFCQNNFKQYIYINLEKDKQIRELFSQSIDPGEIINAICIIKNVKIIPQNSVIFFDEIQESEDAIRALKYFSEANKYNIVCAGSILGVAINRMKTSFPVGKVYRLYMYAFDFEEFLWALGYEDLSQNIKKCFEKKQKMLEVLHKKALEIYKNYLYIGGMPASINEFLRVGQNLSEYDENILNNILQDYMSDMSRYSTKSDAIKINKIYQSLPNQLGLENSKFSYKLVDTKSNKRYLKNALDWLEYSFIVQKCTLIKLPQIPLKAYKEEGYFKIYVNDVGLLARLAGFGKKDLFLDGENLYKGMLAENYVANALTCNNFDLYYWRSNQSAELDFLISLDGNIIPIEVKSALNTKSKSLKTYIQKYNPKFSIKISSKNFGQINNIHFIPLYAVYLLR
ncbi:MAG: ATPase [Proteobacteria bacterium]|nr:MAG: ATPase [Pseudomonadota bacterium]